MVQSLALILALFAAAQSNVPGVCDDEGCGQVFGGSDDDDDPPSRGETVVPSGPTAAQIAGARRLENAVARHRLEAPSLLTELPEAPEPTGQAAMRNESVPTRIGTRIFGQPTVSAESLETAAVVSEVSSAAVGQLRQAMAILAVAASSDSDRAFLAEEAGRAMTGGKVRLLLPSVGASSTADSKAELFRAAAIAQIHAASEVATAREEALWTNKLFHNQQEYLLSRPPAPPPAPEGVEPEEPLLFDFNELIPKAREKLEKSIERHQEALQWTITVITDTIKPKG